MMMFGRGIKGGNGNDGDTNDVWSKFVSQPVSNLTCKRLCCFSGVLGAQGFERNVAPSAVAWPEPRVQHSLAKRPHAATPRAGAQTPAAATEAAPLGSPPA